MILIPLVSRENLGADDLRNRSMVLWVLMGARIMAATLPFQPAPFPKDYKDVFALAPARGLRFMQEDSTFIHSLVDGGGIVMFGNDTLHTNQMNTFTYMSEFLRLAEITEVLVDSRGVVYVTLQRNEETALIGMKPAWRWPST